MNSPTMKMRLPRWAARLLLCCALATAGLPTGTGAQPYAVNWYKVSGGGGTSTNNQYTVRGTIGQHDAGGPMTNGGFSVTGGFWVIEALQTPGVPLLHILRTGPSSVFVYWLPGSGSYTLQTNGNLTSGTFSAYIGTTNSSGGTNSVTISPPRGNLFFRLSRP